MDEEFKYRLYLFDSVEVYCLKIRMIHGPNNQFDITGTQELDVIVICFSFILGINDNSDGIMNFETYATRQTVILSRWK
ncbi:MAG: hypothetical protein ABI861_12460 [Panacibacter sp.]